MCGRGGGYRRDCSLTHTERISLTPHSGVVLQQFWDPLRLDRGALTWFTSRGNCRQGCRADYWKDVLRGDEERVFRL